MQSRHRFIEFDAAIFTNLEPEHIEAHGSFEKYRDAKVGFFKAVSASKKPKKYFVINKDDENAHYFEKAAQGGVTIQYSEKELDARYPHQGIHAGNIAAAVAMAKALGVHEETIRTALESWRGVSGRMEIIQERPFRVVVDYAHTPKSLELLYRHLGGQKEEGGKLICVLGAAGGGRDRWKRKKFGEIAGVHCDEIVLTNEDPYDEDPDKILSEIESGVSSIKHRVSSIHKIPDRKEAMKKAISLARAGDTMVATGKGSESFIHVAHGARVPWNEREVIEELLKKR